MGSPVAKGNASVELNTSPDMNSSALSAHYGNTLENKRLFGVDASSLLFIKSVTSCLPVLCFSLLHFFSHSIIYTYIHT